MQSDRREPSGILKQLASIPCTYPTVTRLATAARPKLCGRGGGILSMVPYPDDELGVRTKFQYLCLDHAVQVATWRLLNSDAAVVVEDHDV